MIWIKATPKSGRAALEPRRRPAARVSSQWSALPASSSWAMLKSMGVNWPISYSVMDVIISSDFFDNGGI